jgi:indolepyruvate ferredoxin oxidoreductase beta subunit
LIRAIWVGCSKLTYRPYPDPDDANAGKTRIVSPTRLVALEPMEAARALDKISNRTTALVNSRPLLPGSLQASGRPYPPLSALLDPLQEAAGYTLVLDATALAEQAGSPRSLNVVTLGMLAGSGLLPFAPELLLNTILGGGLPAFAEINSEAFRLGAEAVKDVRHN